MTDTSPARPVFRTEHRIFMEWDAGAYISTLAPDFHAELQALVAQYGPPDRVEYRADGEGWTTAPADDGDADDGARFGVCWDNGPATGEFGSYATEEEAEAAGEDWRLTMIGEDDDPAEAEEAYTFHVYRIEPEPAAPTVPGEIEYEDAMFSLMRKEK